MSILSDFRCRSCSAVSEHTITHDGAATPKCPECGHPDMTRLIGAPRILYGSIATDGKPSSDGMTTSIDRWQKGRKQKMKLEQRNLDRHGTYD